MVVDGRRWMVDGKEILKRRCGGENHNRALPSLCALVQWITALTNRTEEERLPIEEGFKRSDKPLTIAEVLELQRKVEAVGATPDPK